MKKSFWLFILGFLLTAFIIRIFQVTDSPPAPYWEEVALGYDAYSISETGKDHHGNSWPILAFESFGDWKPSGYFYALVPLIRAFGLSVFSVRLLSVLAGTATVAGIGVLTWQLTYKVFKKSSRKWLIFLAMLLATVSPWLIQFSRGGWEVNLATSLLLWGVIAGWQAIRLPVKNKKRFIWLTLSILGLFAAAYTYHSARVTAPILGLWLAWHFVRQDLGAKLKNVWLIGYVLPLFLTAFLIKPFTAAIGTSALGQRVAETSIFSDISIVEKSNQFKDIHNYSLLSKIIYHRYAVATGRVAEQFISHFNIDFLFISGDNNPRHSTQYFALFYPFEIVFLTVGAWWILKNFPKKQQELLLMWLVFGILPASLARTVPHALRILLTAPVWLLTTTVGVWQTLEWFKLLWPRFKKNHLGTIIVLVLYCFSFVAFYRHLLIVYPQRYASEWQDGYEAMINTVEHLRAANPDLPTYITREQGRPAMYYWFYTKTDPITVQLENDQVLRDQGEYLQFKNIYFINNVTEIPELPAIVASSPGQFALMGERDSITDIKNTTGDIVWRAGVIEN